MSVSTQALLVMEDYETMLLQETQFPLVPVVGQTRLSPSHQEDGRERIECCFLKVQLRLLLAHTSIV